MSLTNNVEAQWSRILDYLRNNPGGATTLELTSKLDILRPGARICELRREGHKIITHFVVEDTALGKHRNIAKYVLLPQ